MAYILGQVKTVSKRVEFELPADDGQEGQKADFVAEFYVRDFKFLHQRQLRLVEDIKKLKAKAAAEKEKPDFDDDVASLEIQIEAQHLMGYENFIREDVASLSGIMDDSGNEVEYTPEVLEQVLNDRYAGPALVKVWAELNNIESREEKRRKN